MKYENDHMDPDRQEPLGNKQNKNNTRTRRNHKIHKETATHCKKKKKNIDEQK